MDVQMLAMGGMGNSLARSWELAHADPDHLREYSKYIL
jgi:hypothetical protein